VICKHGLVDSGRGFAVRAVSGGLLICVFGIVITRAG